MVGVPGRCIRRKIQVASLWIIVLPSIAAGQAFWRSTEEVIPGGQDQLIGEMLGLGATLPGECKLAGAVADRSAIHATYTCDGNEVVLALEHPSAAPAAARRTTRFAIVLQHGTPPPGLVDALESRIRGRENDFHWLSISRPLWEIAPQVAPAAAAAALPAIGALMEVAALVRALRRKRLVPRPRLVTVGRIAISALRIAGLVGVVLATLYGASARADPPLTALAVSFGVAGLAGFLWLTLTGFFGYADLHRNDWVALIPFAVALIVREMFTLHSVQEINIHFVHGTVVKHSVVYAWLQLFFAPIVADSQSFTMQMNGVLGSLACLSMYIFVRQRLQGRAAGFLSALFLAAHPLVARFSPTDGPYGLLLAAWFSGLAMLSARTLDARAIFGGAVLLGIAATSRMEGAVVLVAALLMLDWRVLFDGVRHHYLSVALSLLTVATLGGMQAYFVLPSFLQSGAAPAPFHTSFDIVAGPVAYNLPFTALVVLGALSGMVIRRWLGLFAFIAMLVVVSPVADSATNAALHRLVPACALQAMVAGIGAYGLMAGIPLADGWNWLAVAPGALVAFSVLFQYRSDLTKPYVFTEEYDLVRPHLAAGGKSPRDCTVLTFRPESDSDIHDFGPVVPDMKVLDCGRSDCVAELSNGGCFYYVRSATCFFHPEGVPPGCDSSREGNDVKSSGCLSAASASFERSVDLEVVEVRTVDLRDTFAVDSRSYPEQAQIGLFRARPKSSGHDPAPG